MISGGFLSLQHEDETDTALSERMRQVDDETYRAAANALGEKGLVGLVALAGC